MILPSRIQSAIRPVSVFIFALAMSVAGGFRAVASEAGWKAGTAITDITPSPGQWMAGLGARTHPAEGTLRTMAVPSEWPQTPLPTLRPPPLLGEHSAQVLAEAGYSPQQILDMVQTGVTRVTTAPNEMEVAA